MGWPTKIFEEADVVNVERNSSIKIHKQNILKIKTNEGKFWLVILEHHSQKLFLIILKLSTSN